MNKARLEYEMKVKGISSKDMCGFLKMSRSAFYRKCNMKSEFTRKEIEEIIAILGIDKAEAMTEIFFNEKVS